MLRGPPEPTPGADYDLSPARPEDWTLGGVRVRDMMIDQARAAQLPDDAGTKCTAMWTAYVRKTYPEAFVADAPMVQATGQHAEMNAPEILRKMLWKVASVTWLVMYGCHVMLRDGLGLVTLPQKGEDQVPGASAAASAAGARVGAAGSSRDSLSLGTAHGLAEFDCRARCSVHWTRPRAWTAQGTT